MNTKSLRYVFVFVGLLLLTSYSPTSQREINKEQLLMRLLRQSLESRHYLANAIDDNFSKKVFKEYLEDFDYRKQFLLQSDVDKLRAFETKIDDEMMAETYQLFDLAMQIRDNRWKEAKAYYQEILASPFDFSKEETYETDIKKIDFAVNEADLKERWRKYLKFEALKRVYNSLELEEKKDKKENAKSFAQIEEETRKALLRLMNDWFLRMEREDIATKRATFINAITACYDPHTTYYAPRAKEYFDMDFSGRYEGIGARLTTKDDGTVKVSEVMPGGPAWRQGILKAEDVIIKVAQGEGEPTEVTNMILDDVVKLIKGKKGTEVRLTIKKLDGTISVLPITRDVVIIEETYAKSVILDNGDKKKIGYINLPGFYADFSNTGGRNCAEDIKKEITKLKEEGVQGIILDLRSNGGGALSEVIEMTGLFIDKGPIVQVKGRVGKPGVGEDEDPTIHYDGALAVMVNSMSASASEILAGAIQDYKRGIIIGSKSTYGKGTVQSMLDLDRYLPTSMDNIKPLGALALTIQKFYRVNGGTNQLTGVIPDVILPDIYGAYEEEIGEKKEDFPLAADKIEPLNYNTWSKNEKKIAKAQGKSAERVAKDPIFNLIAENSQRIKNQNDVSMVSLNLE
nr:carboxy terminal-processing peptidase [Thermoflexibacter sp.]